MTEANKPEAMKPVLAWDGHQWVRAMWVPRFTEDAGFTGNRCEYNAADAAYYLPEGWYERQSHSGDALVWHIHCGVTEWRELPPPPPPGEADMTEAQRIAAQPVPVQEPVTVNKVEGHFEQPHWGHVGQAFIDGAREARTNPDATDENFVRCADGYTKRLFEELDPESERLLRENAYPMHKQGQGDPLYAAPAEAQPGRDYKCEIARLTDCLKKANTQAEHFEREWYLRGDEIERLMAQPPAPSPCPA
jgi:hypothetical protein